MLRRLTRYLRPTTISAMPPLNSCSERNIIYDPKTKIEENEPAYLRHLVTITSVLIQTGNYTHAAGEHSECNGLNREKDEILVAAAAHDILFDLILNANSLATFDFNFRERRENPESN